MLIDNNAKNRLLIFFFYDTDGVVDDYITVMLRDLKKSVKDIFVVCNGKLNDEGKEKYKEFTQDILIRKNTGFDVWAYKEAIESIGFEKLKTYDEVILMNYTIMGPVHPFAEMFTAMSEKDLDFWGLTKYHMVPYDPWGLIECGYIREHIQSHFIVIRNKMLKSEAFEEYWTQMRPIKSYQESVSYHESFFTHHFHSKGYKWDVYVDTDDLKDYTLAPINMAPTALIRDKRCPIFKRRSFMGDYDTLIDTTVGEPSYVLMNYLKEHTDYDTNLIWDNLLRCYDAKLIKENLHLNYVLSTKEEKDVEDLLKNRKIAVLFHIYYEDLIEYCYEYIKNVPATTDVYITTASKEKAQKIEAVFKNLKCNKLDIKVATNRGRDVGPFLVESQSFIKDYDYALCVHEKKVTHLDYESKGYGFSYKCFENLLGSPAYVKNILATMEENPRLGMMMPSPPNHAEYFGTLGGEWGNDNFKNTKKMAKRLDLHVPMHEECEPIAPLGGMFWFRPKAMAKLFDYGWKYEDFPPEPIEETDGTMIHAIERIFPYVVQDAGYYPAWCFSDTGIKLELTNLSHMLRDLVRTCTDIGVRGAFTTVKRDLKQRGTLLQHLDALNSYVRAVYPDNISDSYATYMILFYDEGKGYSEKRMIRTKVPTKDENFDVDFVFEKKMKNILNLRFDPGEEGMVQLKDVTIRLSYADGSSKKHSLSWCDSNGYGYDDSLIFLNKDPQIYIHPEVTKDLVSVRITGKLCKDISGDFIEEVTGSGIPKFTPKAYFNLGEGYTEEFTKSVINRGTNSLLKVDFGPCLLPEEVSGIRFDPCEKGMFLLREGKFKIEYENGSVIEKSFLDCRHNGQVIKDGIWFFEQDPQIIVEELPKGCIASLKVEAKVSCDFNEKKDASLVKKIVKTANGILNK